MRTTRPWLFPLWLSAAVAALLFLLLATAPTGLTAASNIRVPSDQPTIQAAIDSAVDGDTVLVAPGTYYEKIDFNGKAITVASEQGPAVTIIDANRAGSVVAFDSSEGPASVLNGFTLQNGFGYAQNFYNGGGISIFFSSPTVTDNIIINNSACGGGGGIGIISGSPVIQGNLIANNHQSGCSGGGGGGIRVLSDSEPLILDNVISNNSWHCGRGGGIHLNGTGVPTIKDNLITHNNVTGNCISSTSQGGGIWAGFKMRAAIVQNLITGNSADEGGGIYWTMQTCCISAVNNTIVNNDAPEGGSGVFTGGFGTGARLVNNIVVGRDGQTAVFCGDAPDLKPPLIEFNDVFAPLGTAYGGICPDQTGPNGKGINGNISADPLFVDASSGDYHLQPSSPVIDAGDNTDSAVPDTDFDGNDRVLDGDGDVEAVVDMGVYESPAVTPPCSPGNTRFRDATAEAADTGGDGDGFELSPTRAFADDAGFASNIDGVGDRHRYYNYGFSIASTCSINGIQVHLDWGVDSTAGENGMSAELSWDGGASWTAAKTDTTETTSAGAEGGFHTATLGSGSDSWGRTWTVSELSDANFRVRVTADCSNGTCEDRDYFLDWVAVKVNYGPR